MKSLYDQFEPNRPNPGRRAGGAMKAGALCLLATVAALTAGCGSAKLDKTGTPVRDKPVVLTLADHENGTLDVQNWIHEVQRRSGGTIRIEFRQRLARERPRLRPRDDRGRPRRPHRHREDRRSLLGRGRRAELPRARRTDADRQLRARAAGADQRSAGRDDQGSRQAGSRRARRAARLPAQASRHLAGAPQPAGTSPARGSGSAPAASPARRSPRSAARRSSTSPATQPPCRGSTAPSSTST